MKTLKYKVLSNEFCGLKMEFTTKREAASFARNQRKSGWSARVIDMRSGKAVVK